MLDQKDLELLQNLMQEVVKESEQNILNSVDKRLLLLSRMSFLPWIKRSLLLNGMLFLA